MSYPKTYNPCDDCQYSYSKNGQESNTCKICEFKQLLDNFKEVRHGEWIKAPCSEKTEMHIVPSVIIGTGQIISTALDVVQRWTEKGKDKVQYETNN